MTLKFEEYYGLLPSTARLASKLSKLFEQARKLTPPTPEQEREAAIDWVWGNLECSTNHRVSRELVAQEWDKLKGSK